MLVIFCIGFILLSIITLIGIKKPKLVLFGFASIMLVVFAFNRDNNDYLAYKVFFDSLSIQNFSYINRNNTSPLFTISMLPFKLLNLTFDTYRFFVFSFVMLTIYFLLRKRANLSVLLLLYSLFPFYFDLVQLRYMWSVFFVILALLALSENKRILFLCLVIISSLFHSMNVVFALLLFVHTRGVSLRSTKFIFYIAIFFVLMRLIDIPVISILANEISNISYFEEYTKYLYVTVNNGYLLYFTYQIANILFSKNLLVRLRNCTLPDNWEFRLAKLNQETQLFGMIFVILTTININFSRYFRILYLLNAITLSVVAFSGDRKTEVDKIGKYFMRKRRYIITKNSYYIMIWIIMWLVGEIIINGTLLNIVKRVFGSF